AMLLPVAMTMVVTVISMFGAAYERISSSDEDSTPWYRRFVATQLVASAAWGLMPWLCWDAYDPVNHMFLACAVMAVIAALVVSRGSNMAMYIASLAPITIMTAARFLA